MKRNTPYIVFDGRYHNVFYKGELYSSHRSKWHADNAVVRLLTDNNPNREKNESIKAPLLPVQSRLQAVIED